MIDGIVRGARLRVRVRPHVQRLLAQSGHPPIEDRGGPGPRTLVVGHDPVRILLFGGGVLVGHGVRTRAEAVDGPLAALVAERTGRGVVLEPRVSTAGRMEDAVAGLGGAGVGGYHVAIWSPAHDEGFTRLTLLSWRRALARLVADVRAQSDLPLILAQVPLPAGRQPVVVVGRRWATQVNRTMQQVAARHPGVRAVELVSFTPPGLGAGPIMDAPLFRRHAERLLPAVLAALDPAERASRAPVS